MPFEQAGLVGDLVRRFLWCICTAVTYLGLSLGFHSWSLKQVWQKPDVYIWSHGMVSLFTLQRTGIHTHSILKNNIEIQIIRKTGNYFPSLQRKKETKVNVGITDEIVYCVYLTRCIVKSKLKECKRIQRTVLVRNRKSVE